MPQPPEITLSDAREKLSTKGALFLDIRDAQAYGDGHIPGARPLNNDNVGTLLAETSRDTAIVVYCDHGVSSRSATTFLLSQGFQSVHSMRQGFDGWRAAGHEIETRTY